MKRLALGLLLAAALLYALATALVPRHAGWGYLAAFAEAAMVGAIADWFAVVALFRHPLGLPIPHTAIIPSGKGRIGDNLAGFIATHFLATEQVLDKLREFDAAGRLAGWLARPANAERVGRQLAGVGRWAVQALDDEHVRGFVADLARRGLGQVEVARLSGQLLEAMTHERRHQELLDGVLAPGLAAPGRMSDAANHAFQRAQTLYQPAHRAYSAQRAGILAGAWPGGVCSPGRG